MNRREFLRSTAATPAISLLPDFLSDTGESKGKHWELSANWNDAYGEGRLVLLESGEEQHDWSYDSHMEWQKNTLLNTRFVADSAEQRTGYVADLWDLRLTDMHLEPPYFTSKFEDSQSAVHVRKGRYSEWEYVYELETHGEEALFGFSGGADTIDRLMEKIDSKV